MTDEERIKNLEYVVNTLGAETLALQRLLVAVTSRMMVHDSSTVPVIKAGFDETARFLEDRTIEFGASSSPHHLAHSVKIVEQLRSAIFDDHEKPKRIV